MSRRGSDDVAVADRGSRTVDEATAAHRDELTETESLGARLRRSRKARGLSLEDVARAAGLTRSFLSLVERDQTAPSVASLIRICETLDIRVGSLFDSPRTALVRADLRPQINFGGQGVTEYLLTPANSRLQILHSYIEPSGGGGEEPYTLAGEAEFALVLEGRLEIEVGGTRYELGVNDSLSFSPDTPHTWRNPSDTERAVVLWVLTPSPW